ncbi:MAG: M56 family metallopeptidase [Saprospiraceae bacterium]|nr:M56 family metallopeptidase [Saprospiraceae bacterium]
MQYLLESAFCLALFYAFYLLVLRRETFFQINRWYLLLTPVLAFGIPALNIRLEQPPAPVMMDAEKLPAPAPMVEWPSVVERVQTAPRAVSHVMNRPVWSLQLGDVLWCIYGAVAALFLLRLAWQIIAMIRFIRRCRKDTDQRLVMAEDGDGGSPASFFGYVFWQPGVLPESERRLLLEHEMVHVRQWHSLDLILIEILIALQWFNPLLYLYRRSLREVHEFIADDYVVRRTRQRYAYAGLLVQYQTAGNRAQPGLVNTFHSLIKNRLIMLAKRPSDPLRRVKYLFALPLLGALMLLFSFRLVERLQDVRNTTELLEQYAASLSEVVIATERPHGVEPTPYIFYWGAFQAKFNYASATKEYFAEIHISPDEFREAIKREPRLWTGETLLQRLSMVINGQEIKSDYYNPEIYKATLPALQALAEKLTDTDYIKAGNITLPEGKSGEILIFLDGARPGWIPKDNAEPNKRGPVITEVLWGKRSFTLMEDRYVTISEFWDIIGSQPLIRYKDAPERTPTMFNLAISNAGNPVLRYNADEKDAYDLETLRERLRAHEQNIKPGAVVHIAAWDAHDIDIALRQASMDTIITFDPVTYQQTTTYVTSNGSLRPAPAASELIALRLVADADPRRLLRESDTRNFSFEWGPYSATFPNRMFAESYDQSGSSERLHADRPVESHSNTLTKKDILQMLRAPSKLYRENDLLTDFNFTLDYKGYGGLIQNGEVPDDLIRKLERELQPGESIRLTGFQARTGASRKVIATQTAFQQVSGEVIVEKVEMVNIDRTPGDVPLISLLMKPDSYKALQDKLAGIPGIWFKYGEIDLSPVTFILEVRNEDPKPALRPLVQPAPPEISIRISPNPASEVATIHLTLPKAGEGLLTVTDLEGKLRFSVRTEFAAGDTPFQLPLHFLKGKGLFMVQIAMPYGSAGTKMVVE